MESIINPIEILLQINERLDRIEDQIGKINETHTNKKVNQVLTTKEACKYLHISTRSLQLYRDRGKIDFIQIGGKVLFRSKDLDKFLARFRIKA
jgi:excisionase family DNA binding protein